ncbi:zinc finger BED domain-containing protein 5-like [Diorhabda sublineata]|uniref:zinc finger BED domain-containing protein 5-like n=1 Tax=Diorhabda sublineata TaxID=1163346 RepID=UPI0024E129E8|nr:zinc finger BED domain-containing protein 5-like [Diorhabda sublineata]
MAKNAPNKRQYSDDYIKYGFSFVEKRGTQLPQYIICQSVLSNDAMRPSRLDRHLFTNHFAVEDKPVDFFIMKKDSLERMKLDATGSFRLNNDKAVEASYMIALLIAKDKKLYTIDIKRFLTEVARQLVPNNEELEETENLG